MLIVVAIINEFVVRVITNDVPIVDVNVDESAVAAVAVGSVANCVVGDGIVLVLGASVRIAESAVAVIIDVGMMHGDD